MTAQIEINAPLDKVFDLYTDKQRYSEWKLDFVSYEPVSGTPGDKGSVTMLHYKTFTMKETVTEIGKPNVYNASYEYLRNGKAMMTHIATNKFTAIDKNKTLLEAGNEITGVNGFFMKLMMKLMAKAGEKQFLQQLQQFKELAEK